MEKKDPQWKKEKGKRHDGRILRMNGRQEKEKRKEKKEKEKKQETRQEKKRKRKRKRKEKRNEKKRKVLNNIEKKNTKGKI